MSREPDRLESDDQENENGAPSSPSNRANHSVRRYSEAASKTPLRDITSRNTPNSRDKATWDKLIDDQEEIAASIEDEYSPHPPSIVESEDVRYQTTIDDQGPVVGDDEYESAEQEHEAPAASEEPILPALDDEEVDQTFEPQPAFSPKAKSNSRRKRKSDLEVPTSSPAAKRPRREDPEKARAVSTISEEGEVDAQETVAESSKAPSQPQKRPRGRPALKERSTNVKTKPKYPKEVKGVIEKVRARPNPPKQLYILRRETPADDGVTHTRSGRVSFKPLAFWRNEQCVYGGSPSGAGLKDGARFPLNSVKEIIRTEEVVESLARTKSKKRKGRTERSKSRTEDAEVSDSESDEERVDPDAEAWETSIGTLRGAVQVWDSEAQAPIDEVEDIDIAYAPAAIQRSVINVKSGPGPAFKYAKLLGNKFMGVGLVELEPGGIKRPKNSRKMHMSFFVVKGRVTVSVGPAGGEETGSWSKFSIGKGGFWQVPRGKFCDLVACVYC